MNQLDDDKSGEVEFDEFKNRESIFEIKNDVLSVNGITRLISHPDFNFFIHKNESEIKLNSKGPNGIINLGLHQVRIQRGSLSVELSPLESALLPTSEDDVVHISSDNSTFGLIY